MKKTMTNAQIDMTAEIIVDNFAGGGGASTGIELAAGRPVDIAINHDPDAILMHKTNHPHTEHFQASVWDVDPVEMCRGRPVGLAWFSPDCKHFSKAKGSALVDRNIRGLAWIVLRWAALVRPRVIILENVEEFQTWGPVRKGKPVKKKAGETFRQWKRQLSDLGYDIQHRELVAADYGAPTIRKRFFLIARCDGRPIVWPEPTHAPADSPEVKAGKKKPWKSAAEIIDWNLPCPSIFDSKEEIRGQYGLKAQRPLRPNTLRRVARGLDKFVLKEAKPYLVTIGYGERQGQQPRVQDIDRPLGTAVSTGKQYLAEPYLVQVNHGGEQLRGQDLTEPLPTVTGKHGYGVAEPTLAPWTLTNTSNSVGAPVDEPTGTVRTGGGGGQMLVTPALIQYHTEQSDYVRGQSLTDPICTIDAANRYGLMAPVFKGTNLGQNPEEPLQTITAKPCYGVVKTTICKVRPGANLRRWPQVRELLNTYCGYQLADDEIILIWIDGTAWYIADIGLRMLTPRELYAANGFPPDYIIERDYLANEYGKAKQVARCGNAVPPPFATALVRANLPEWCSQKITTMAELTEAMAV